MDSDRADKGAVNEAGAEWGDAALIELRRVSKAFGATAVLRDVSLTLHEGSVTALVGASGCGKSTLLKLCNGLLVPDGGEVRAFASPLTPATLPALRRRMGYAVQGAGLFPHLTVRSNIAVAAELAAWSAQAIAERLEELLKLMHLPPALLSRFPHQLSGGQQQRVGLCRAMMLRPQLLLLDEPFAAIDPLTRYDIHQQLREMLAAEPVAVLLVTHDMREAMDLAERVLVMGRGQVCVDARVEELRAAHPDLAPEALLHSLMGDALVTDGADATEQPERPS